MSRDLLRRSHVLVVCGHTMTEAMKNDIAVAQRLGITARLRLHEASDIMALSQ